MSVDVLVQEEARGRLAKIARYYSGNVKTYEYKTYELATPGSICLRRSFNYDGNLNVIGEIISEDIWTQDMEDRAAPVIAPPAPFSNTKSVLLDGINERIVGLLATPSMDITNNLSVFLWFKTTTATTYSTLISRWVIDPSAPNQRQWMISMPNTGRIEAYLSVDGIATSKAYQSVSSGWNNGTWHMIGFTFATNVFKLYIDGVESVVNKLTDNIANSLHNPTDKTMSIGMRLGTTGANLEPYFGQIDEVTIWKNAALTSTDVATLYNAGNPIDPSTLVSSAALAGWWRMGDGDVYPTFFDNAGTSNLFASNMEAGDIVNDAP